jgi:purine-binding chemotaxis protein CheW
MMGLDGSLTGGAVPQHIFFLVGDAEFALPASSVQSVERLGEIAKVPNTAPWILGVVQVWGNIVSVVDFRQFVGLPAQPVTIRSRLLVVSHREMTIGFVIDAVTEMRPLGGVVPGPVDGRTTPGWATAFAQGSIQIEGHVVTLLDPDRLLFGDKIHRYRADVGN